MKVIAKLNNLRISPRKVRRMITLIKGLDVQDALVQLNNALPKTANELTKLLKSAIANAENNFGLDRDNLYVWDIQVNEGVRLKRWLPRASGRATPIIKRTSHVNLILEERVEGKNRKSKEQLAKERKEREEKKKEMEERLKKDQEKAEKEKTEQILQDKSAKERKKVKSEEGQKKAEGKGWVKKIFQRKSG